MEQLETGRHLGVDPSVSIGIGDNWNDVEMFQVRGMGIAMGNVNPELKALADETTTSVREDGVWNAFVRHGLTFGEALMPRASSWSVGSGCRLRGDESLEALPHP